MAKRYSDQDILKLLQWIDEGYQPTESELRVLRDRRALLFWGYSVTALPESVGLLSNLQTLDLTCTKIFTLPDYLGKLSELRVLGLGGTGITELPEFVRKFPKLEELYIWGTKITALPEWIGDLPALRFLDLEGLTLPAIPESLAMRELPFTENQDSSKPGILLKDVTLMHQDRSILLENPELIPSLYQKDQTSLRECRVIFLGDGAAGKSYTIRRFRAEGRPETVEAPYTTSETPGVEILDYRVGRGNGSFTLHFWDFGGQQLLHSMHRCFLTDETCYVVMVKTRETKANDRARYWLRNVEAFAPKSPILLFVNCWENDDGMRSIDEPALLRDYPNIQKVIYCSAKQASEAAFRETVMDSIIGLAASSKGLTRQVPTQWVRIRKAIEVESAAKNYLDRERYHELCDQNGVENEQAPALLSFFNTLGVCFSFHRDREKKELTAYKLLNPVWLTNAIYAIIEEGMAFAEEGRIQRSAVEQMLGNQAPRIVRGNENYRRTIPTLIYTAEECRYVLDVAAAHDLCYAVDENTIFFPALCTNNTPQEALSEPTDYTEHGAYCFQYAYLPDNVVHQLMVRCLRKGYTIDHSWLRGIVLGCLDDHRAIIRMTDGERLRLDLYSKKGRMPYELFLVLRSEILDISERLNLICHEYILRDPDSFRLTTLLLDRADGTKFKRGEESNERVEIEALLERFYDPLTLGRMQVKGQEVKIGPYPWHEVRKDNAALRRAIWEVYNRKCVYCGKMLIQAEVEIDHIYATKTPVVEDSGMKLYLDSLAEQGFDLAAPDYIENYLLSCKQSNDCKNNRPFGVENLRFYHELAMRKTPEILKLKAKYEEGRRWSDQLEKELTYEDN